MDESKAERLIRESRSAGDLCRELREDARQPDYWTVPAHRCDWCPEPTGNPKLDADFMRIHLECFNKIGHVHGEPTQEEMEGWNHDRPEDEWFEGWSNGEPVTIAIRVCGTCKRFLGHDTWRGDQAHPEMVCETAGLCPECYDEMAREIGEGE